MNSEQASKFKQFGDRVSRDQHFVQQLSTDAREARDLSSRLGQSTARSERAEAGLSERTGHAQRLASSYERGELISIDIAQDPHNIEMFNRYAERYGGSSAAAQSMMSAELARQALRPFPQQSSGSALPLSFDHVGAAYGLAKSNLSKAINVEASRSANDARINASPLVQTAGPRAPTSTGESRALAELEADALRSSVQAAHGTSSGRIGRQLVDGTLTSDRSLLMQSTRQAGKDATKVGTDSVKQLRRWLSE